VIVVDDIAFLRRWILESLCLRERRNDRGGNEA
jgi:hypothetical protein